MEDDFLSPEEARAQRKAVRDAKAKLAQDDAVVQSLMGSEAGREWVRDLLDNCGVFRTVAHENPYFTYLNEGRRNIGLSLLAAIMRACPEAYIQMMQEGSDATRRDTDPDPDPGTDPDA